MSLLPLHTAEGFADAAAYTDALLVGAQDYLLDESLLERPLRDATGILTNTDPVADSYSDVLNLGIPGLEHSGTSTVGISGELEQRSTNSYAGIGDLGNKNSQMREDWWFYLRAMRRLLRKAHRIDPSLWTTTSDWREKITIADFTGDLRMGQTSVNQKNRFLNAGRNAGQWNKKHEGDSTPDLFVFRDSSININRVRAYWWVPYAVVARFVTLHNQLFGTNISYQVGTTLPITRPGARGLIRNVMRGLGMLQAEIRRQEEAAEAAELAALEAEAAMIGTDQEGFVLEPLTSPEMETLARDPAYQQYFSTTFNKDLIAFVPIIQNFFLTGKYFQTINESFYSSNALALEILLSTIRNNDNYKKEPNLRRVPPTLAAQAAANTDPQGAARDFILKMLIMAPINILKGICELLDPHVGITKLIKKITGYGFSELAEAMNPSAETINETRKNTIKETEGEDSDAYKNFRGINGDDLLKFILCILELSMQAAVEMPAILDPEGNSSTPSIPPNFFPAIKRDGIDFTGKVSGLLMMPPTPLGLIYLLLGLINTDEETVDVIEETPDPACPPPHPEDPSVAGETTVDQCDPEEIS